MTRALLDTSVVVAFAQEQVEVPDPTIEAAISIVTLCELHHGVLSAGDDTRADRLRNLSWARHRLGVLPADDRVAPRYGQLMFEARRATGAKPKFADALIAATAMVFNLPIISRDRDFKAFQGVEVEMI